MTGRRVDRYVLRGANGTACKDGTMRFGHREARSESIQVQTLDADSCLLHFMQPILSRGRQAALLRDRDEIVKVPQLHGAFHIPEVCPSACKVFLFGARGAYIGINSRAHGTNLPSLRRCQNFCLAMLCR
jgi:hypothetical protein